MTIKLGQIPRELLQDAANLIKTIGASDDETLQLRERYGITDIWWHSNNPNESDILVDFKTQFGQNPIFCLELHEDCNLSTRQRTLATIIGNMLPDLPNWLSGQANFHVDVGRYGEWELDEVVAQADAAHSFYSGNEWQCPLCEGDSCELSLKDSESIKEVMWNDELIIHECNNHDLKLVIYTKTNTNRVPIGKSAYYIIGNTYFPWQDGKTKAHQINESQAVFLDCLATLSEELPNWFLEKDAYCVTTDMLAEISCLLENESDISALEQCIPSKEETIEQPTNNEIIHSIYGTLKKVPGDMVYDRESFQPPPTGRMQANEPDLVIDPIFGKRRSMFHSTWSFNPHKLFTFDYKAIEARVAKALHDPVLVKERVWTENQAVTSPPQIEPVKPQIESKETYVSPFTGKPT